MSDKERTISARLDIATAEKLEKIMKARGISKSAALRLCINGTQILQIGNAGDLASEFCKIRDALENNKYDETARQGVDKICQSISVALQQTEGLPESERE